MIQDKICIRFIGISHDIETVLWSFKGVEFVEQLVHDILASKGVGPVYRTLFGLKSTEHSVWLAPNVPISDLIKWIGINRSNQPKFELRMRFRPSCYKKLLVLDKNAFEIIFAQIRHDFMHTRFNNEKRDFVLLNDAVLALVTTDLLRYAIEHNVNITEILKRVNPKDFIPRRASKWQRTLLFRLAERINLQKSLQIGYKNCDNDITRIKHGFIELFLLEVAQDYGSEVYNVVQTDVNNRPQLMEVRVRYHQTQEESYCYVENRPRSQSGQAKDQYDWTEVSDIDTISQGTLRQNVVQIARPNDGPIRFKFESEWHARSFLSMIDGYYRLMRKWNFNLCRDVSSPDLIHLKRIRCHGPIGFETSRNKLSKNKKPETFLIRRCMEKNNRYLIDALLQTRARLTIDVEWNREKNTYRIVDYSINRNTNVMVRTDHEEYLSLKNLVNDTEIRVFNQGNSYPQQLKYWLQPGEYDDCPSLLLSMSKKKLKEFEVSDQNRALKPINELPRLIPPDMLQLSEEVMDKSINKTIVRLATLNGGRQVIVKNRLDQESTNSKYLAFHYCPGDHDQIKILSGLKPDQVRIADWIFVKHHLFAETIGFDLTDFSMIQEYFPHGPLDKFLSQNSTVAEAFKLSVCFQLAEALLFLQEKQIIHGKIRCHNVFISQLRPVQVKVADPVGTFDAEHDQAFIPSEYLGMSGLLCVKEYVTGIDVWALGTTMWQIYSDGLKPRPGEYGNTLIQPKCCPDKVWNLIENCWCLDPSCRVSPQMLYRDLNDLFVWEKGAHFYYYVPQDAELSADDLALPEPRNHSHLNGCSSSGSCQSYFSNQPDRINDNNRPKSHSKLTTAKKTNKTWKSVMSFKKPMLGSLIRKNGLSNHNELSNLSGSRLSIFTCSTRSGSEATKLTDVFDCQSITDVFDRPIWLVESSRLKLGPEIGRGTSSVVMKGVMSRDDGFGEQMVAVKCVDKESSSWCLSRIDDLRREFDILKNLNHKNIVKTLGYVEESYMMLIFEYMPLGSLLSYIKNSQRDDLHALPLQKYAYDIASGMEYLESMRIVHRDLALRNILAKSQNEVKICDFGLAQFLGPNNHYSSKTDRALPLKWYAPETIATLTFTHKSDVWSYGVVLWEIYSGGNSPQYSGTCKDLYETLKHERLLMPRDCPVHMYNLMLKCWAYNPEDRDSFSQISDQLRCYSSLN